MFIFFSSVLVAEWQPFRKRLLTRKTICSLCIFTIRYFSYFPVFGKEGWIWVLIALVPDLCTLFTFFNMQEILNNS